MTKSFSMHLRARASGGAYIPMENKKLSMRENLVMASYAHHLLVWYGMAWSY